MGCQWAARSAFRRAAQYGAELSLADTMREKSLAHFIDNHIVTGFRVCPPGRTAAVNSGGLSATA